MKCLQFDLTSCETLSDLLETVNGHKVKVQVIKSKILMSKELEGKMFSLDIFFDLFPHYSLVPNTFNLLSKSAYRQSSSSTLIPLSTYSPFDLKPLHQLDNLLRKNDLLLFELQSLKETKTTVIFFPKKIDL